MTGSEMDEIYLIPMQQQMLAAQQELRDCNAYSVRFGLTLRENDIAELVASRAEALRAAGRIEFGGGILPKLIRAFCDSPFIMQEDYAAMLAELQEAFYRFKNEATDRLTDDELIGLMVNAFDGRAQGSAEYLAEISLEALLRCAVDERGNNAGGLY